MYVRGDDADIEVAFFQSNFAQIGRQARGEKARRPPIDLAAIPTPRAAVVIAQTEIEDRADRTRVARLDVTLEKAVAVIVRRQHNARKNFERFIDKIPLKSVAGA